MSHPKIQFKLNKKLDIEIGAHFLNNKVGSYDFGKDRIISEHPEFSKWRNLDEKDIIKNTRTYVNKYYDKNIKQLNQSTEIMQKMWDKIEDSYFNELEKVFGTLAFYKPRRINAYLSIFKCGVIDDNMKAFQIWYKTGAQPSETHRHVAHEVLHFYYYTYLQTHGYEKLAKDWDAAEIFNRIILNLHQFLRLTGQPEMGYTQHTRKVPKYLKIWKESSNINQYLKTVQKLER